MPGRKATRVQMGPAIGTSQVRSSQRGKRLSERWRRRQTMVVLIANPRATTRMIKGKSCARKTGQFKPNWSERSVASANGMLFMGVDVEFRLFRKGAWSRRRNPSSAIAAAPAQARFLSHRLRACHCSRRSGPRCSWSTSLPVKSSELCRTSGEAMQSSSVENGQPQSNARTKNSSGRRCATRCSPASLDPSSTR